MKIVWTKLALKDLQQVWNDIAGDNLLAAHGVMEKIDRAVQTLLSYQNFGRIGRVRTTRELVLPGLPYIIPYRMKKKQIEILAVIHSSRRWPEKI